MRCVQSIPSQTMRKTCVVFQGMGPVPFRTIDNVRCIADCHGRPFFLQMKLQLSLLKVNDIGVVGNNHAGASVFQPMLTERFVLVFVFSVHVPGQPACMIEMFWSCAPRRNIREEKERNTKNGARNYCRHGVRENGVILTYATSDREMGNVGGISPSNASGFSSAGADAKEISLRKKTFQHPVCLSVCQLSCPRAGAISILNLHWAGTQT